jgi:hypothetical protein
MGAYFSSRDINRLMMMLFAECPYYTDRLVWLQGLCNIGSSTHKYTMEIFTDSSQRRNERLMAAFASDYVDNQYYTNEPLKVIL